MYVFFFFKQKTAYEMRISDWSSDVCSSDLYISDIGFSVPLYRTAIGRAILSLMSPEERAALHQRTLETAPQLADGKAEADQGVEDCKTDGFCFASSWRDRKSTRLNSSH